MSAIFQQAIQSFQAKNYKQAKIILFAMLKITPKHCEGLHMMGLIFGLENKHQEALNYLHKAVKLEPDNFEINFNLAKALSEAGAHKKALQYHEITNNLNNKKNTMETVRELLAKLDNKVTPTMAKKLDGMQALQAKLEVARQEYEAEPNDEKSAYVPKSLDYLVYRSSLFPISSRKYQFYIAVKKVPNGSSPIT